MTEPSPRYLTNDLLALFGDKLEEIGAPVTKHWRPGLREHEMDELTSAIGISLSAEARIWWGWHDGVDLDRSPAYSSFGPGWDAYSLAHAVDDAMRMRQLAVTAAQDQPDVQNQDWSDSWLALCGNVSYTRIACDCSRRSDGRSSIHYFDPVANMEPSRPRLQSIGELVHAWIDAIDDGTWRIDSATGNFALWDPTELLHARGPGIADLL